MSWWKNGQKSAVGQNAEGWRTGHWVFYDQQGVKTGEQDFVHGNFDGKRVQYYGNGKVKMEEVYANGKQLSMKTFDQNGLAIPPEQLGVVVRK